MKKAGLDLDPVENFVHGTTVAINTAIERTGARTALVVTKLKFRLSRSGIVL